MKYSFCFSLLFSTTFLFGYDQETPKEPSRVEPIQELPPIDDNQRNTCKKKPWYFEVKPGYFYFSDSDMRQFFDDGGFIFRVESGCMVHRGLTVWIEGSYFQKEGQAIGGNEPLDLKIATITLGLKGIFQPSRYLSFHLGAGPRVFMMLLHNESPFVRGQDNAVGVGGGFDAGFWLFPIPCWPGFYIDGFADYSWKKLKIEPDVNSSLNTSVDVSGISAGVGIGLKF